MSLEFLHKKNLHHLQLMFLFVFFATLLLGIIIYRLDAFDYQVPRNSKVDADDLIISGDGANCYDDEDCSSYSTDPSNSDDLITPRIVVVNQRPPYSPVEHGFRTSTPRPGHSPTSCSDDEDCYEGSGDDEDDDDNETDKKKSDSSSRPSISYNWHGLRTPSPTPFYARAAPTPYEDKSIMFTSKPIPPDPVIAESFAPTKPRVTLPPRPTGPRVIIDVPKPDRPHLHRERTTPAPTVPSSHRHHPHTPASHPNNFLNKSSNERTVVVIGLIAIIVIVIVIVAAILVFCLRKRPPLPKSIDNHKNYQFHPVSGTPQLLLPNASASVTHLSVAGGPPLNSDFKPQPQIPILPKKDLKEWYV